MNQANQIPRVTDTNPRSVLRTISLANGFDVNETCFDSPEIAQAENQERPAAILNVDTADVIASSEVISHVDISSQDEFSADDTISLRINPATQSNDEPGCGDVLEHACESANQIQQLAAKLNHLETELRIRESELEDRISAWDLTVANQQIQFDIRSAQLQQQASQVRCQQLHLMQLQTDIIKSHEANRQSIESLVAGTDSDARTLDTMKALKQQLGGRFDYISRRWEHLAELMADTIAKNTAEHPGDDCVDWSGELG